MVKVFAGSPAGLGGAVEEGEHRVEAEAALERARGSLLFGARLDQRRVEVDEERPVGLRAGRPGALARYSAGAPQRAEQFGVAGVASTVRQAVASEATAPKSGSWSRTARRSARWEPPEASITARSRTTRPGRGRRGAPASARDASRAHPSAQSGPPSARAAPCRRGRRRPLRPP